MRLWTKENSSPSVSLLLRGHFCAISRHFYSTSIYKNSISIYKNGLRKNPSPFIYSRGMPINTGVPRLIGLFYPFITLHHPSSFCHFLISTDNRVCPMLLFEAIICLLLWPVRGIYYDQFRASIMTIWREMKGYLAPFNAWNPDKPWGFQTIDEGWRVLC